MFMMMATMPIYSQPQITITIGTMCQDILMVDIGGPWMDGLCMVVYGMIHGLTPTSMVIIMVSEVIMPIGFPDGIMDLIPVDTLDGVEEESSLSVTIATTRWPLRVVMLRAMVV